MLGCSPTAVPPSAQSSFCLLTKATLLSTLLPVPFLYSSEHRPLWLLSFSLANRNFPSTSSHQLFQNPRCWPQVILFIPLHHSLLFSRTSRGGGGTGLWSSAASLPSWSHSILQHLDSTALYQISFTHSDLSQGPIGDLILSLFPSPSLVFFRKSQFNSCTCLNDNNRPGSSPLLQSPWMACKLLSKMP